MILKLKVIIFFQFKIIFKNYVQAESGYEFTSKLAKMFQDIALSKTLNDEFKKNAVQAATNRKFQISYSFNTYSF